MWFAQLILMWVGIRAIVGFITYGAERHPQRSGV